MTRFKAKREVGGLTLVELMISLTIGLILTAAIGYIFIASRQAFRSNEGLSRIQENTRTSVLLVNTTLRLAGYLPDPVNQTTPALYFVPTTPSPYSAVRGNAASALNTDYPGIGPPALTTGTEYLEVTYLGNDDNTTGQTVRSCQGSVINSSTIVTNVFYISKANGDPVYSLYCAVRTATAGPPPSAPSTFNAQPIVYGVTSLTVQYGIDSSGDQSPDHYVGYASVADWTQVKSLQLTMTVVSPDTVTKADTTGTGVQADSSSHQQRTQIQTIQLRNRLIP